MENQEQDDNILKMQQDIMAGIVDKQANQFSTELALSCEDFAIQLTGKFGLAQINTIILLALSRTLTTQIANFIFIHEGLLLKRLGKIDSVPDFLAEKMQQPLDQKLYDLEILIAKYSAQFIAEQIKRIEEEIKRIEEENNEQ